MEKFCAPYISYGKRTFFGLVAISILIAPPPQAWAASVNIAVDTTLSTDSTADDYNATAGNITITNDADISFTGNDTLDLQGNDGITVINNGTISTTGSRAIDARGIANTVTITNSGTLSANTQAIALNTVTNFTITNNVGATITATETAINTVSSGGTIDNFGTISGTGTTAQTFQLGTSTGGSTITLTNHVGAVISSAGSSQAIRFNENTTIINFGTIKNTGTGGSLSYRANDSTVILKEGSILVGSIGLPIAGLTGIKLQIEQGFGQAYFYSTDLIGAANLTLEDLSGNTVVAGSAGSVGQGANESVDELLGLRAFNLRSALKRFASFPKQSGENELYAEPFSFYSKRGSNNTVLGYEAYGGGINFIYPLKQHKLDLILSVGHSEQDLQGGHDISRNNFLAGVNATEFASLGNFKFSGFFVAGMEWHNGDRDIYTNTTSTGKLNVTSDYTSYEAITGSHVSYSYSPDDKNTWKTEVGLTFAYSLIQDYEESQYFTWEERDFVQGSIHIGEELTSKINDKLTVTVGAELEHRTVLSGREQSYAINGTTVDYKQGSFWESTAAGRLGATYLMDDNTLAYVNIDSRFSNHTRGTYGISVGMKLNF